MGKSHAEMDAAHRSFVDRQRVFFTGSAAAGGRVNVSPKDGASLRVLSPNRVVYLDQTGSGNETAAHVRAAGRLTLMFCSFEGTPLILRLYGHGRIVRRGGEEYRALLDAEYGGIEPAGARQMVVLEVDRVQTSCGYGVPQFEYAGERRTLLRWAEKKGETGMEEYRRRKNVESIDGLPTGILEVDEGAMREGDAKAGRHARRIGI
jgi:hypothetical protein